MEKLNAKKLRYFANFLNSLARDLTNFYYKKLDKPFKVVNKLKGKGYDPVTSSDKAFEKVIRLKIKKKFPSHEIIGEEYGYKKTKSDFTWIIDPIDGTRSYVIGNPTWSNLISLNYKGYPVMGLANFPMLNKYYLNYNDKISYVVENGKIAAEKKQDFGEKFISLARSVYKLNDKRASLKLSINKTLGSNIKEVKSHE